MEGTIGLSPPSLYSALKSDDCLLQLVSRITMCSISLASRDTVSKNLSLLFSLHVLMSYALLFSCFSITALSVKVPFLCFPPYRAPLFPLLPIDLRS